MPPELPRPGWAQRLYDARRGHRWDRTRLARELRRAGGQDVSASADSLVRMIRDWENGVYRPRERYWLLLTRVLELDGQASPAEARLPSSSASEVAAQVRASSAHIVALDTRLGARDMVDAVVRAAVHAHRTAHARFPADKDVLAAAAEAQQIAGWVAFDAERQTLSRQMTLEALLTARTAGDRSMEHFVLGQLAMQDIHLHQPVEAAHICDTALQIDGARGSVRTIYTLRAARAAAQMGETMRALDLIGETRSRYLEGPRSGDPAWTWWLTDGEISWHHAMICADAGQWGPASEHFAAAAAFQPSGYDRGASVSVASLLWALAHARDWDEAETVLLRDVLPHRGETASARAERFLSSAASLFADARGRPTLRDAAHSLAGPAFP